MNAPRNPYAEALPRAALVWPHVRKLIEGARALIDARPYGEALKKPDGSLVLDEHDGTFRPVTPGLDSKGNYWVVRTPQQQCLTCSHMAECRFGHCDGCATAADPEKW